MGHYMERSVVVFMSFNVINVAKLIYETNIP